MKIRVRLVSNASTLKEKHFSAVSFKKGVTDDSGRLSSWVGEDCCVWYGVGCSNQTGNIIKLDLKSPYFCDLMSGDTSTVCLGGVLSPSLLISKLLGPKQQ